MAHSPNYNTEPTDDVELFVQNKEGAINTRSVRWGLAPVSAKEIGKSKPLMNARSETVAEKPAAAMPPWMPMMLMTRLK